MLKIITSKYVKLKTFCRQYFPLTKLSLLSSGLSILLVTSIYFLEIYTDGAYLIKAPAVNGISAQYATSFNLFHDHFIWNTKKIHEWIEVNPETFEPITGNAYRGYIIEPSFSLWGYVQLIAFTIITSWLLVLGGWILFWKDRKYLYSEAKRFIASINPFVRILFVIIFSMSYALLKYIDLNDTTIILVIFSFFIFILLACLITKKLLYEVTSTIMRAIRDVGKN